MAEKKAQSAGLDVRAKRARVEPGADEPHICRQRKCIGLDHWYTKERPASKSQANLVLMRRIEELYFAYPLYGSRRISAVLRREGFTVKRKQVRRLMQCMDL